jgi:ubiquinol oxidase
MLITNNGPSSIFRPYFAYLSVMHLRETFGNRELGDKMRTHYAGKDTKQSTITIFLIFFHFSHCPLVMPFMYIFLEADNELHHLLIMESLGGNENSVDRFLAQIMAFGYYWYVTVGKLKTIEPIG